MSKYKKASSIFILNELEALCDILLRGTQTETEMGIQIRRVIHQLRAYYEEQGWL